MGKEGSSICLRKKNIGLKGINIICDHMILNKDNDDFIHYAHILYKCVEKKDELETIESKKIHRLINDIYKKKSIRQEYCEKLSNLIGSSTKSKVIQGKY